ncbi:MAG: LuxR family transcriptional regulator, maltose regulon positive regulatory protein, partial [Frankiaceae bacterium]|nr:LuxR family transcriptional regulator, maltose regulon positive regulatory protein [Frankiaceae bacterium]
MSNAPQQATEPAGPVAGEASGFVVPHQAELSFRPTAFRSTASPPAVPTQATPDLESVAPVLVRRAALLQRLQAAESSRLVVLSAPAGYGKTALLWQWACEDARTFVWLDVPRDADEPVALLAYIAQALHLLDDHMLSGPLESESFLSAVALPRLGAAMQQSQRPFVLVLDDTHLLRSSGAWQVIAGVVAHIPHGSHLVLSGRAQPGMALGGLNAHRDLLHLDAA